MKNQILFLLPYPLNRAPSQRFRVEAYFAVMQESQIPYHCQEFLDIEGASVLYRKGSWLKKAIAVSKGFLRRAYWVFWKASAYDYVFIHREAAPLGPPFFEWWLARVMHKKIIYDFDDAIWISNITRENKIAGYFKAYWKIKHICRWAHKVSVGNSFLADYAKQFNEDVIYNPTCVDINRYNVVALQDNSPVTVGWTGSHSTIQFLQEGVPALQKLEKDESFRFLIICDKKPAFDLKSLEFLQWNSGTEVSDLATIQIGIMPLKSDAWSEGKCGFKIIQYLALGIPAVASPVGVNKTIIEHGVNGFLCNSDEEWISCLKELLHNPERRKQFGIAGRKKIIQKFSVQANAQNFLSLFKN